MTSPIRQALGAHLGQVLTPEIAALIEQAAFFAPEKCDTGLLEKWRHLIEPTIQASITPMPWADVLQVPCSVMEGLDSVLVITLPKMTDGKTSITVWVAAGDMGQVLDLFSQLTKHAKAMGVTAIKYAGRKGWVRAAGFTEMAIYAEKEI